MRLLGERPEEAEEVLGFATVLSELLFAEEVVLEEADFEPDDLVVAGLADEGLDEDDLDDDAFEEERVPDEAGRVLFSDDSFSVIKIHLRTYKREIYKNFTVCQYTVFCCHKCPE